ncbi:hypothetical protein GSI_03363 [Ganoderma sinense ZZ0214-1]|uniref:Uncharacterized protein n=1 Tax=Ganoderma sinense ZZ0214-1 TaxID=1077348 RepID=A0A2G8SLE7_9APHY|nr:hypothetical protein GSI_03363 [Ganoderma sinense ZZ0214-1]
MFDDITSSLGSLGSSADNTTSQHHRSASPTGGPGSTHTSRYKGDAGVQDDPTRRGTGAIQSYPQKPQPEDPWAVAQAWWTKTYEAEERVKQIQAALTKTEQDLRRTNEQVYEAEHRINELQTALTRSQQELCRTNDELRDTAALLDRRSAELRDAQAYLSHPDDVADAEVLHLVERINSRIFQTAASIADAFQSQYGKQKDIQASQEAATRVRGFLGSKLLHALSTVDYSRDPSVVQTALQAAFVSFVAWLCATWDFGATGRKNALPKIYQHIRKTEQQSVAGRWRALSRTYVKMLVENGEDSESIEVHELVRDIADILLVCGVVAEPQNLHTEIGSTYADALREVIHLSFEVQRIAGEVIISRDLQIFTARRGKPFDPSRMIDKWGDPKKTPHAEETHPVLCTTQLGLVREEIKATEGGVGGEIVAVVLLEPTVVLTSFLEQLPSE